MDRRFYKPFFCVALLSVSGMFGMYGPVVGRGASLLVGPGNESASQAVGQNLPGRPLPQVVSQVASASGGSMPCGGLSNPLPLGQNALRNQVFCFVREDLMRMAQIEALRESDPFCSSSANEMIDAAGVYCSRCLAAFQFDAVAARKAALAREKAMASGGEQEEGCFVGLENPFGRYDCMDESCLLGTEYFCSERRGMMFESDVAMFESVEWDR